MNRKFNHILYALFAVLFIASCQSENPTEPNGNGSDKIEIGENVTVTTQQVSTGGGVVMVSSIDTLISGLQITIPPNSYPDARTFTVSYAPIKSHKFGEFFKPISPLITISNGGGYADSVMTMKIPISLPQGAQPVAFFFDDNTGKLEPITMSTYDDNSVTIMSMHFDVSGLSGGISRIKDKSVSGIRYYANIVISYVTPQMVMLIAQSKPIVSPEPLYLPGVDDWEFINMGSYLGNARSGHCEGQDVSSYWYFFEKKLKGAPQLYNRYDSVHSIQPTSAMWQDNQLGYRMASAVHNRLNWGTLSLYLSEFWLGTADDWTWQTLIVSMYLCKEPYAIGLYGVENGKKVGHHVTAYSVDILRREISIADPNYPGDLTRRIQYDGSNFTPYLSGLNAANPGLPFDVIRFDAKTATINWTTIGEIWNSVVENKQNPGFSPYSLYINNGGFELTDYLSVSSDSLDVSVSWSEPTNRPYFQIFDRNGVRIAPFNKPYDYTDRETIKLLAGENIVGICMYAALPPWNNPKLLWNDFKWYHIFYNASSVSIIPNITTGTKGYQYVWSGIVKNRPNNVRYEWDFGDGSPKFIRSNDSVAYYSYNSDGEYTIKLQVFDRSTNKMIGEATATASIHSGPEIISVVPQEVSYGATVYISGRGFGATQGTSTLKFGAGLAPKSIISWRDDEIVAIVPEMFEAVNNYVTVTVNGIESNQGVLNCKWPEITSVSPDSCQAGEIVAIKGKWFGHLEGNSKIVFGLSDIGTTVTWSDTMITIIVPEPSTQVYSFNYINFTRGNGSTTSHSFAIIENILNTLQRTTCFSGLIFSGNFKMSVSSPTPHEEYQNTSIPIESNGCQVSKMVWDNRDFSVTITAIAQYDTNITTFNGTVSFDGKTLETINARYYQGFKNSTNIRELHFKNIPIKVSYPYYNRVTFELSGAELQDHFVKAVADYLTPTYTTRYIETDWSHATIIPRFSVTLYKP